MGIDGDALILDADEAPQQQTDLGACPTCSNCMEELTQRGGVLCRGCFAALYQGVASIDYEMAIEAAEAQGSPRVMDWSPNPNVVPRERDGSPLNPRYCDTPGCLCDARWGAFYR